MRHGTLSCWLWGHKFKTTIFVGSINQDYDRVNHQQTEFCVRCGLSNKTD